MIQSTPAPGPNEYAIIDRFVELFIASPFFGPVRSVLDSSLAHVAQACSGLEIWNDLWVAPRSMLTGPPDAEGLAPWCPIASPLSLPLVAAMERFLQCKLPLLFVAYLTRKALLSVELYVGTLPRIDPRRPLEWLEWSYQESLTPLLQQHPDLVPFSMGTWSVGPLYFDIGSPARVCDYPIVMLQYSSLEARYQKRSVFPDFQTYLEFLNNWLLFRVHREEGDFLSWLELRNSYVPPKCYIDGTE
jgi:hypothetical protein